MSNAQTPEKFTPTSPTAVVHQAKAEVDKLIVVSDSPRKTTPDSAGSPPDDPATAMPDGAKSAPLPPELAAMRSNRSGLASKAQVAAPANTHVKLRKLILNRESSKRSTRGADAGMTEFDKVLQGLLDRTENRDEPGAAEIRALGVRLVLNTAESRQLREDMNAITLYDPAHPRVVVGYLFVFEDVGYLLSVTSASKLHVVVADSIIDVSNAFTVVLGQLIVRHQAQELHVGRFDRLVRSQSAASDLRTSLAEVGCIVHTDVATMNVGEDATMFNHFAFMVEYDWVATMTKLTNGWHHSATNGRWPFSEGHLPASGIGYQFESTDGNKADSTIVPVEADRQMIVDIVNWAADETLTTHDVAKNIAAVYGWGSPTLRERLDSPTATILDARHPETAVLNLLKVALPLWASGEYEMTVRIPQNLKTKQLRPEVQALVEKGTDGYRYARFTITCHHEKLAGGEWMPVDKIVDAQRVRFGSQRSTVRGRAAGTVDRKPLAGIAEWIDGDRQYKLSARHSTHYALISRDATLATNATGDRLGWLDDHCTIDALLNPAELHRALADAVITGLETGSEWNRTLAGSTAGNDSGRHDIGDLEQLEANLAAAQRVEARAAFKSEQLDDLAIDDPTDDNKAAARAAAAAFIKAHADSVDIAGRIARVKAIRDGNRALAVGATADAGALVNTLATLAQTTDKAPAVLGDSLRRILTNMRVAVSPDALTVSVSTDVLLATSDGLGAVGPFTATVRNCRRNMRTARKVGMLERVLLRGNAFDEAARDCGYTNVKEARRFALDALHASGVIVSKGLRSAALDCPIPEAKRVIWEMLAAANEERSFQVPDGIDPAFAAQIRDTYAADRAWVTSWHIDDPVGARAVLAMLTAISDVDKGLNWDDIVDTIGYRHHTLAHFEVEIFLGKGGSRSTNGVAPVVERVIGKWTSHTKPEERRVRARQCPYCETRTLTHIVRAPEVLGGMLCTSCHRAPLLPSVVFPDSYLIDYSGPRKIGTGSKGALANTGTRRAAA